MAKPEQLNLFQLRLNLFGDEQADNRKVIPSKCPHMGVMIDGIHNWCNKGEFWTECTRSICGEPPRCALEPLDNSPEAVERRLRWIKAHKKGK